MLPKIQPSLSFLFTILLVVIFTHPSLSFKQSDYEIKDLYSTTNSEFTSESSPWISTTSYAGTLTTTCAGTPLYSGDGIPTGAGPFQRKYENLPTHMSVFVSYELWIIDLPGTTVDGTFAFGTAADPILTTKTTYSSTMTDQTFATTSTCGTSENDLTGVKVLRSFSHTDSTLYLSIQTTAGYSGFRNLQILIVTADLSGNGNCVISNPMAAIGSTYTCKCETGKYYSSSLTCESCDSACSNCFNAGASSCLSCADGYYYDGASCVACDSSCSTCFGPGTTSCLTCPSGDEPDANSQCSAVSTAVQNIINVKSTTQKIVGAGLIASSVTNVGGSSAVRVSVIGKMIQYIKYLELDFPSNLEAALKAADSDFLNFGGGEEEINSTPNGLVDNETEYHDLPSAFTNYDEVDPSFMINFWNELKILIIISAILVFVLAIEFIANKNESKFLPIKHIHKVRISLMGLLLNYVYNDAADVFFFALIGYRATNDKTSLANLNIAISVILIFGTVSLLTVHFCLIKKYQNIKNNDNKNAKESLENFDKKYEGMKALWADFKDTSLFSMGYLWLAITRDIVFCLILTLLFEHPLAQTVLIVLMSLAMLGYLLKLRPIEEAPDMIQTLACESILFSVNFCLLILAGMDQNGTGSTATRDNLGMIILVLTMIFNWIPMAFLVVTLVNALKAAHEFYQAWKLKKSQAKQEKPEMHAKKNQVVPFELVKDEPSSAMSPNNSTQGILTPINNARSPLRSTFKSHFSHFADENMSGYLAKEDALYNSPLSPTNQPLRLNDSVYRNKGADQEVSMIELDQEKLPEQGNNAEEKG